MAGTHSTKPHPDPQRSVLVGELDPWVTLPMSISTSILASTRQRPRLVLSLDCLIYLSFYCSLISGTPIDTIFICFYGFDQYSFFCDFGFLS